MGIGTETVDAVIASLVGASIAQDTDATEAWMIFQDAFSDVGGPSPKPADQALCVYETGGRAPLEAWAIQYPTFQVVGRGAPDGWRALRDQMQLVLNQLHSNEGPLGSAFVYCYATHSAPLNLGTDEKRRPKLAWNFRCMRNNQA